MISSLEHGDVTDDDFNSSLVTARLCDSSDSGRQQAVRDKAADIEGTSQFFAVYVVPLDHIGIIARMQATVQALRPDNLHLDVAFGIQHMCIQETSWRRLELLSVLKKIKAKGHQLSKTYNKSSSLADMEHEYESLNSVVQQSFPISPRRELRGCCVTLLS